jgi:hypothetical protein
MFLATARRRSFMTDSAFGINSIADKRYYHFVLVKSSGLTLSAYWRKLSEIGEVERPHVRTPVESQLFSLEHRKLRLEVPFARGATSEYLSERGNGRPPFFYDLFAGKMEFKGESYLLLGYPFSSLALMIVGSLEEHGFSKDAEYQNVNLPKWLSAKNRPFKRFEGLNSNVVSVQFVVTGDESLTGVRLGGPDPFSAEIYKEYLQPKFEGGSLVPDLCVLASDRQADERMPMEKMLYSRLHIDKYGNFKFYMHAGCSNVTLLPYVVGQIRVAGCLGAVSKNPIEKAAQGEGE